MNANLSRVQRGLIGSICGFLSGFFVAIFALRYVPEEFLLIPGRAIRIALVTATVGACLGAVFGVVVGAVLGGVLAWESYPLKKHSKSATEFHRVRDRELDI